MLGYSRVPCLAATEVFEGLLHKATMEFEDLMQVTRSGGEEANGLQNERDILAGHVAELCDEIV